MGARPQASSSVTSAMRQKWSPPWTSHCGDGSGTGSKACVSASSVSGVLWSSLAGTSKLQPDSSWSVSTPMVVRSLTVRSRLSERISRQRSPSPRWRSASDHHESRSPVITVAVAIVTWVLVSVRWAAGVRVPVLASSAIMVAAGTSNGAPAVMGRGWRVVTSRRVAATSLAASGWVPGNSGRRTRGRRRRAAKASMTIAVASWAQAIQTMTARVVTTKVSVTPTVAIVRSVSRSGQEDGRGGPTSVVSNQGGTTSRATVSRAPVRPVARRVSCRVIGLPRARRTSWRRWR